MLRIEFLNSYIVNKLTFWEFVVERHAHHLFSSLSKIVAVKCSGLVFLNLFIDRYLGGLGFLSFDAGEL